jgi:leader peptidase (prepilin peptidase)/N-methyltransferase
MTGVVAVGCGLLGLLVGSFLNVVVHRVPRKESVVRPRSRCPACGTTIAARDNVPVLSWLLLRGRCRACGAGISARYPLVELLTAVVFAGVGARFGAEWAVPAYLLLAASLVAVSFVDLEHFLVPNRILLVTLYGGVPLLVLAAVTDHEVGDLGRAAVGAVVGLGLLLVVHLVNPRGMGMGDVKLAGVLGLFLGFLGLGHVFLGLFLGFLLGSVVGILLIATKIRSRRDHIPFAPYLAAGALLTVYVGDPLLAWYRG